MENLHFHVFRDFLEIYLVICQMLLSLADLIVYYFLLLQADGLCKLLSQNCKTLTSLKFVHCKLSSSFMDAICGSLYLGGAETHQIQHFSVSTSSFLEPNPVSLAHRLASFLSAGRYCWWIYGLYTILVITWGVWPWHAHQSPNLLGRVCYSMIIFVAWSPKY